jgi:hypothetical protein
MPIEFHEVKLEAYNYDTKQVEDRGTVDLHLVAKNMKTGHMAYLLESFLNGFDNQFKRGQEIGTLLQGAHRTLQGITVNFTLGILVGLSKQDWTDLRNEKAVALAKKVAVLVEQEGLQPFI